MKIFLKAPVILLIVICAVAGSVAQDKLRRIEQPAKFTYSNTPIQVLVKMDGEPLPAREIVTGPDWLRRLSLEVTNTSGKDINWLSILLTLREPPPGVSKPSFNIAGIVIPVELRHAGLKVLSAGSKVTIKPPTQNVDYWIKFALENGLTDIEKVILEIRQVGFTDDTGWYIGSPTRKDPESGRYLFVTGNPDHPISLILPKMDRLFFDLRTRVE